MIKCMQKYDALYKQNIPFKVLKFDDAKPFLKKETAPSKSVAVFLMPYSMGTKRGNVSYYAKGRDYHLIARNIADSIGFDVSYRVFSDVSPFDEVSLAAVAGLGMIGENGLLINDIYGSLVFIAEILIDDDFDRYDSITEIRRCEACGRCKNVCPSGNIADKSMCVSHLTQKKGELTVQEERIVKNSGYIWGCDICQCVCPYNKLCDAEPFSLEESDLEGLSNRTFKDKYKDKAFTWRGVKPLLRNIEITKK